MDCAALPGASTPPHREVPGALRGPSADTQPPPPALWVHARAPIPQFHSMKIKRNLWGPTRNLIVMEEGTGAGNHHYSGLNRPSSYLQCPRNSPSQQRPSSTGPRRWHRVTRELGGRRPAGSGTWSGLLRQRRCFIAVPTADVTSDAS